MLLVLARLLLLLCGVYINYCQDSLSINIEDFTTLSFFFCVVDGCALSFVQTVAIVGIFTCGEILK